MKVAQGKDVSATLTQEDFSENLQRLPTSPERWAGRKNPLSTDGVKFRQCKLGELCWVAAASRPDICVRVARIALRINALCGSGVIRINEIVRAAKEWQQATVLKSASPSRPSKTLGSGGQIDAELRNRRREVHCSLTSSVGWSDASSENQSTEGKCR